MPRRRRGRVVLHVLSLLPPLPLKVSEEPLSRPPLPSSPLPAQHDFRILFLEIVRAREVKAKTVKGIE